VLGRYLLSLPLPGTTEITEIILGILIYIGLPYITRDEEHVTVSLFSNYFNNSIIKIQKIVVNFIVSIILFIIARQIYLHGLDLNLYNEITTFLEIPKAPIAYLMATLSLIASIMALCNCYKYLYNKKQ
jgi:TRAP-type C4-dicarboxylate transport system permease small subunit